MKENEIRKHAVCSICGKKILSNGIPLFYKVTIERFVVNLQAMQRQTGLAMMIGNAKLAQVMGPDEDMAEPVMDAAVLTVCESCDTQSTCVAALAELSMKGN